MAQLPQSSSSGGPTRRGSDSLAVHGGMVAIAVVVAVIFGWLLFDALRVAWHIIELVVVAAATGWAGYRIGRYRGRREHQS